MRLLDVKEIKCSDWDKLMADSSVATWFQAREAYEFYQNLSFLEAFAYAIENGGLLKAVMVGFIQKEGGRIKQFFSRRAIVLGGPLLADDVTNEELTALLCVVKDKLKKKAIYIETRNFNDYGRWKAVFEQNGFEYEPHLNFHVNTESVEVAQSNVGKHRWRYIRISLRDGASRVECPSHSQIVAYYEILRELYQSKVKTPLFPLEFFEKLYEQKNARFFIVELEGVVIGGSVCVCLEGRALYEWFVCGNENYRKGIRPSSVATWLGIEYAAQNGYPVFDLMGAGKPNEKYGVRDFKAEYGGKLVEHGRFRKVCKPLLFQTGKIAVKIMKRKGS